VASPGLHSLSLCGRTAGKPPASRARLVALRSWFRTRNKWEQVGGVDICARQMRSRHEGDVVELDATESEVRNFPMTCFDNIQKGVR